MTDKKERVKQFLAAPRAEMLAEDAFFQALARTSGRAAYLPSRNANRALFTGW